MWSMDDKYYSISKAAKELKKSRPTIYKMIEDGRLKIKTIAGRPVIAISEIKRAAKA